MKQVFKQITRHELKMKINSVYLDGIFIVSRIVTGLRGKEGGMFSVETQWS